MTNTVLEQSPSGASPNQPAAPSIAKTRAKRAKNTDPRYLALRNFAISISIFNILGYTVLGFEQPWLWPLIAIATGYTTEIVFEVVSSWAQRREPRFRGNGARGLYEFLLPSHITALAVNMLLYANNQIMPIIFGVFVGVAGKHALQAPIAGRMRHFMNPSNFGITVSLLCFGSWISIAPPYEFTEKADTFFRVMIPIIIATAGTVINGVLTKRVGLIMGWMGGFFIQALIRHGIWHVALFSAFGPMTGVAFVLFTNYMITDPGTTPSRFRNQFMFGGSVAFVYAALMEFNVVYTLFFATSIVCASRGIGWWMTALYQRRKASRQPMASLPETSTGAEAVAA
ncbi:enediyne biosynthesis protein [Streptomyces polygonati]|uniref:Enediyne biosynthesis protein n=1 Tax=Streptomyces polygonati TaxID=1617087 RepID=A0ABV8HK95_9ACTN